MGNKFQEFDEIEFQKMIKLSDSLSFDDVQEDSDYLRELIFKHHPDGKFRLIEENKKNDWSKEDSMLEVRLPAFVMEFNLYLLNKYKDRIYANAVSRKVFSVFFKGSR